MFEKKFILKKVKKFLWIMILSIILAGCGSDSINPSTAIYKVKGNLNSISSGSGAPSVNKVVSKDAIFKVRVFGNSFNDYMLLQYNSEDDIFEALVQFKPVHIVLYKYNEFVAGFSLPATIQPDDEISFDATVSNTNDINILFEINDTIIDDIIEQERDIYEAIDFSMIEGEAQPAIMPPHIDTEVGRFYIIDDAYYINPFPNDNDVPANEDFMFSTIVDLGTYDGEFSLGESGTYYYASYWSPYGSYGEPLNYFQMAREFGTTLGNTDIQSNHIWIYYYKPPILETDFDIVDGITCFSDPEQEIWINPYWVYGTEMYISYMPGYGAQRKLWVKTSYSIIEDGVEKFLYMDSRYYEEYHSEEYHSRNEVYLSEEEFEELMSR